MTSQNFSTSFLVDQTPKEVFDAINNVRGWWSGEIDGDTGKLGAGFTYRYKDMHRSQQRITEFVPGRKVVWHVVDSSLRFLRDKSEWTGTDIVFEIAKKNDGKRNSALRMRVGLPKLNATAAVRTRGGCS